MRQLIASLIDFLPFDARGRRAVDETMSDWAHEEAMATGLRRGVVHARALTGVLRTVVSAAVVEAGHVPYGWLAGRLLLVGVPLGALFAGRPIFDLPVQAADLGVNRFWLAALLLPQAIPVVLPIALFAAVAYPPPDKRVPVVGLAVVSFAAAALLLGWVVPNANQEFRETMFAHAIQARPLSVPPGTRLQRGPAEWTAVELIERVVTDPSARLVERLVTYTGLAVMNPALVILGAAVATLTARRRRHWMWAVPLAGFGSSLVAGAAGFLLFAAVSVYIARRIMKPQPPAADPWVFIGG